MTGSSLNAARQPLLGPLFTRWPALRWAGEDGQEKAYQQAFDGAVSEFVQQAQPRKSLLAAEQAREQADGAVEHEEALLLRFASVYEHVVEARELQTHGKPEIKARYERIVEAENRYMPLPK